MGDPQPNTTLTYHGIACCQVAGVLTVQEAQRFIDAAESLGFQHQSSRGAAYGEAFRDNDRISLQDAQLARQLWQASGLQAVFQGITVEGMQAVGLNPNIRLYRCVPTLPHKTLKCAVCIAGLRCNEDADKPNTCHCNQNSI